MALKTSKTGLDLIKSFEGCQLKAYRCPAGVWTIGWGTTEAINGVKPHKGMAITQEQADKLLIDHLKAYENAVNRLGVPLNQNQFDALVSFCYNLGTGIFKGNLLTAIKAKNWASVASQLCLYNKARVNGKLTVLKGLDRRRRAESALFLKECDKEVEIKKIKVKVNGAVKEVNSINVDGNNFIKLQDLKDGRIAIGYDGMPVINTK